MSKADDTQLPADVPEDFYPPDCPEILVQSDLLIAADWWDEHDEPEKAQRLRAWLDAARWLTSFCYRVGRSFDAVVEIGEMALKGKSPYVGDDDSLDRFNRERDEFLSYVAVLTGQPALTDEQRDSVYFHCAC